MDTCEFSYISRMDSTPRRVLGIEQSWEELKRDMGRAGSGCTGAIYFKTISAEGPQLFAVVDDHTVFYHEHGQWHRYITACDIKFGTIEPKNCNMVRATKTEAQGDRILNESS